MRVDDRTFGRAAFLGALGAGIAGLFFARDAFRLVGKTGGDSPSTQYFLNTGTFLKRNREWRAVAWQATKVAGAAPERPVPAKEAEVNLTPGAVARPGLTDEIRAADAEFFKASFDTCDIATVRRYVTDDFEMFHDKGGRVATSGADYVQQSADTCKRQSEGIDFLSTRKLVPGSLKVTWVVHLPSAGGIGIEYGGDHGELA